MDQSSDEQQQIYIAGVGAMMVGLLLATFFGGLGTLQTALYFISNRGDHWLHKISIVFLWVLAVVQLSFIFHATYFYTITKGVNDNDHLEFIWSFKLQIFMQTIVMSAAKVLYTIRIWNLQKDKKRWIPITLSVLLVIEYGLGTLFAYEVTTIDDLRQLQILKFKYSVFLAMGFNTLTDILVAAALIYTIVKSRPNLEWTSSSWTMLMAYITNTGTITGIFSVIVLIGFATGVTNPLYIIAEMGLPQLYVNCFLSMINASFYFQTKSSLDISISYRARQRSPSYMVNLTRMGHHKDPESLTHRPSDSLGSSTEYSNLTLAKSDVTINEVGLPLFEFERNNSTRSLEPPQKVPVEVQVETTKTEYSIDRRFLYGTESRTALVETIR